MASWYISCEDCGAKLLMCDDWDTSHASASREAMCDVECERCENIFRACRDWEREPRFCKPCRLERAGRWFDKPSTYCGEAMRVCRDWDPIHRIPDYHRSSAWIDDCSASSGQKLSLWLVKYAHRFELEMRHISIWDIAAPIHAIPSHLCFITD